MLYSFFRQKKTEDLKLFLGNIEITKVQSCKYLGMYIHCVSEKTTLEKTTLMLHTIDSTHINRFR